MKGFLKLIRWPNLLMVALTMFLLRYGVIQPILFAYALSLELPFGMFALLVFSVVAIAAAGYIINDYFDIKTDLVNRPDDVIIGKILTSQFAYRWYFILNAAGFAASLSLVLYIRFWSSFVIFPAAAGALWFYSTTYKRQLITGNVLVAFLTSLVCVLPAVFDIPPVIAKYKSYLIQNGLDLKIILIWCAYFALFAFLMGLIREIVKDCEDIEGDRVSGCNTIPVAFGLKTAKIISISAIILVIALLGDVYLSYLKTDLHGNFDWLTLGYFLLLIILPLTITGTMISRSKCRKDFSRISLFLKLIMVAGMFYSLVVRFKIL